MMCSATRQICSVAVHLSGTTLLAVMSSQQVLMVLFSLPVGVVGAVAQKLRQCCITTTNKMTTIYK